MRARMHAQACTRQRPRHSCCSLSSPALALLVRARGVLVICPPHSTRVTVVCRLSCSRSGGVGGQGAVGYRRAVAAVPRAARLCRRTEDAAGHPEGGGHLPQEVSSRVHAAPCTLPLARCPLNAARSADRSPAFDGSARYRTCECATCPPPHAHTPARFLLPQQHDRLGAGERTRRDEAGGSP